MKRFSIDEQVDINDEKDMQIAKDIKVKEFKLKVKIEYCDKI